jgi:hypothetical protein
MSEPQAYSACVPVSQKNVGFGGAAIFRVPLSESLCRTTTRAVIFGVPLNF